MQQIDKNCFELAKQCDERALTMFYNSYKQSIFSFILRRVRTFEDAEDILSKTIEKGFKNFNKIFSIDKVGSFFKKIAYRTIIDFYRGREQKITKCSLEKLVLESNTASPEDLLTKKEEMLIIKEAFLNLPADDYNIMRLRYNNGKSLREISEITERTERAVEAVIYRGKRRLRKYLEPYFKEDYLKEVDK